ncbi:MAG: hypothetical protein C0470_14835 [Verminephrobacter sp.]|nr:hypothetical protein [Verminephrobacter sp.]
MAIHLVGAPHSGVHELLEALTAELGVHTAQLHPLMQALPSADSTLPASPEASLPPLTPITLLTGLDWPCPPAEQDNREQCDAELRRQLQVSGTPYRVVYGSTARRLTSALAAAQALQAPAQSTAASLTRAPIGSADGRDEGDDQEPLKMRSWGCEKCSDPVCEHRLFTSLRLAATR